MNKLLRYSAILFILFGVRLAQSQTIKNQQTVGNQYIIEFTLSSPSYSIIKKNGVNTLYFKEYLDESIPGEFNLPAKDVFVAIPSNTDPQISLLVTKTSNINAFPEITPEVFLDEKHNIKYKELFEIKNLTANSLFEKKGYLWIGDYYCLHLKINIFQLVQTGLKLNEHFKLTVSFNEKINLVNTESEDEINPIILNRDYAKGFRSKPNFKITDTDDWIDYTKTYVKLGTASDGIYRVTGTNLTNIGVNISSINPKSLKIFLKGEEIPIYVFGEGDLSLDATDYVEFVGVRNMGGTHREVSLYGDPYNEYLGRYTDTTVYWLSWDGADGLRVRVSGTNNAQPQLDTLNYYHEIIHSEKNNWFDFSMADIVRREKPYWYENKTWIEGGLNVGKRRVNFTVQDVYPNATFKLFAKLQSYASNISSNAHSLGLSFKNQAQIYDSTTINKYDKIVLSAELSSNLLTEGSNHYFVHNFATAASINTMARDWYEVEYPRYLKTFNDSLLFHFPYLISNSEHNIKITDVSALGSSMWKYGDGYEKYDVQIVGNELIFSDTLSSESKFSLIDDSQTLTPKIYYSKMFTNLRSSQNQADYIAITNKVFINDVTDYLDFISQSYSVNTIMIDVDDVFDEFAYGFFKPEGIRDFLMAAKTNWQTPLPEYVNLIGDATYDYYGSKSINFGIPRANNFVPSFGAPVSDNWFVTWDTTGAYIPNMSVGRLPINTAGQLEHYKDKHQNYLNQPYTEWNKTQIFFSGGTGNNQSQLDQLRGVNEFIINQYVIPSPIGGLYTHFYKTINPTTNFGPYTQEEINEAIDKGSIFISYLGHSGTQTWDNSITDVFQLNNSSNRSTLITDFGCSTSKYAEPDVLSFSEKFVLDDDGQAIAYVGNSSLGFLSTSTTAPKLFYKKLLQDSVYTISKAHYLSKLELLQIYGSSGTYQLFSFTSTLVGDPIVALAIPPKPNLNITSDMVSILPELPPDNTDSIDVTFNYINLGRVIEDSINIYIKDELLGEVVFEENFVRQLPLNRDSINFKLPVRKRPGEHNLTILLDSEEKIEEIYEDDNSVQYKFAVTSSAIRTFLSYQHENGINEEIIFLNPTKTPSIESIDIEYSQNEDYSDLQTLQVTMDSLYTRLNIGQQFGNARYFVRAKLTGEDSYGFSKSLFPHTNNKYLINDSLTFSHSNLSNLQYLNNSILLDTLDITFSLVSAGQNVGNTAIIAKNGQNLIPENTLRGHHVCLFIDSTYEFAEYQLFDIHADTAITTQYISYLDTLTDKYLVMFAISAEGSFHLTDNLKNKIKEFGSVYIDSISENTSSWAFIGKRGAVPGSMPEGFSPANQPRVLIDTLIQRTFESGSCLTSQIGPADQWLSLNVIDSAPSNSLIRYKPVGITAGGTADTLDYLTVNSGTTDISFIDAGLYPYLKIISQIDVGDNSVSAMLNSLGVNYVALPELGINYQVVLTQKDTLEQGEDQSLLFYVYNVGESSADSFKVKVELVKQDNSIELLYDQLIVSLGSEQRQLFDVIYNTASGHGERLFYITVDSENKVNEFFEDNNFYSIPFYVRGDTTTPTIDLTVDGRDIIDGEYIPATPEIMIKLNDPSLLAIDDTTAVSLYLNDEPVYYAENPSVLSYTFSQTNPKYVVEYRPELEDGEHKLTIFGKDASGNVVDSSGISRIFVVESEPKLLNVYNYPNPFSGETYFTFNLTSGGADEVRIRIYTVAGRLIREFVKTTNLNPNFNRIRWNGTDREGNLAANGVYIYKVIMTKNGKTENVTQKLAIVR